MTTDVLVVIGVGGMGQAIARRQGSGKTVLLADFDEQALSRAAGAMTSVGHTVQTHVVDVSSPESVDRLAQRATELGAVTQLAHTAGLSPNPAASPILRWHTDLPSRPTTSAFGRRA